MKKGIQWVDLPENLKPATPAPGTIVEYRFLQTVTDYLPGGGSQKKFHEEVTLPPIFKIRNGNDVVEVGLVGGFNERGEVNAGEVPQLSWKAKSLAGVLYLHPDNDDELAIYQALELHPMVAGNSSNDTTATKVMQKVDHAGEAKKRLEGRKQLEAAKKIVTNLEPGEGYERALMLLGKEATGDEFVDLDRIYADAEANPATFIQKMEDKDADLKVEFTKGIKNEVLVIDPTTSQLLWGDNKGEVIQLVRTDPDSVKSQFAEFVNENKNGAAIFKQLQNLNKAKEKLASKGAK